MKPIEMRVFPAGRQNRIRGGLAETLRGVVALALCKRAGGGRVAAFEIMLVDPPVSNPIREGKTSQLTSLMHTGEAAGNTNLNEDLAKLIRERKVTADEAISEAIDKNDLRRRSDPLQGWA